MAIKVLIWLIVYFLLFPVVYGVFENAYVRLFIFVTWVVMIVGSLSGILIEGIQQDLEHIRRGEDIVTGKKLRKD